MTAFFLLVIFHFLCVSLVFWFEFIVCCLNRLINKLLKVTMNGISSFLVECKAVFSDKLIFVFLSSREKVDFDGVRFEGGSIWEKERDVCCRLIWVFYLFACRKFMEFLYLKDTLYLKKLKSPQIGGFGKMPRFFLLKPIFSWKTLKILCKKNYWKIRKKNEEFVFCKKVLTHTDSWFLQNTAQFSIKFSNLTKILLLTWSFWLNLGQTLKN